MNKPKIFLLVTLLITFIMLFSFAALYFVLPQVYLYSKNHTISQNTDLLAKNLANPGSIDECKELISDFSGENNAMVFSFDKNGDLISDLSSISLMMDEGPMHISVFAGSQGHRISIGRTSTGISLPNLSQPDPGPTAINQTDRYQIDRDQPDRTQPVYIQSEPNPPDHTQPDYNETERSEPVSTSTFFVRQTSPNAMFIEREIGGDLIDKITISSMFQPINEAKTVVLMLAPYLLLLDILLGLIVAYMYLKREEQYAQNKTDFMRAAHHELKTPIAALNGIVEGMIDNVGVYKDRDEYLGKAKEIIDRLTQLTNDVLNATQSMSRRIPKESVDIGQLFDEVVQQHQFLLEGKEFNYHSFQYICKTNRMLLQNVFSNLLSNAARYATGGISISFSQNTLSIANECEPIAETDLKNIYEPFYTLSQSRVRSQSGSGIGLYIVKRNLDALKHKFTMRNTEQGVVFEIFFQTSH